MKIQSTTNPAINSIYLLVTYLIVEKGLHLIGGGFGSFMYITAHFILAPIAAVTFIVIAARKLSTPPTPQELKNLFIGMAAPILIIYFGITGDPLIMKLLGINFNK